MFPNPCFEICKSHQITGHEISNQIKSQEQVAIQISNQFNSKWSITKSNLKYLTNIWQISSGKDYACSQALVPLILVRALLSYTKPIAISGVLPLGLYWTRDLKLKLKYLCKSPANSNQFKSNCSTWQINSQISSQIRQISKEGFVSNIRITKYSNL